MEIYIKTLLWNDENQVLVEYGTKLDRLSLQAGQRRRFRLNETATDEGTEVVGVFDGVIIVGNQVWVDYLLVGDAK